LSAISIFYVIFETFSTSFGKSSSASNCSSSYWSCFAQKNSTSGSSILKESLISILSKFETISSFSEKGLHYERKMLNKIYEFSNYIKGGFLLNNINLEFLLSVEDYDLELDTMSLKGNDRRFQDKDVFESIFYRVLTQGVEVGFVDPSVLFIDSTQIKANANKRKYKKKLVRRAAQQYKEELDQEVNEDRILHGKSLSPPR